jgi:hypothetical protein
MAPGGGGLPVPEDFFPRLVNALHYLDIDSIQVREWRFR